MGLPTDLIFTVAFDKTNTPANFALTDTTDYAALGIALADVRGNFAPVVDPLGNTIHSNTDFSTPDITAATSLLYTDLDIPTDTNGDIIEGIYSFTYNALVDNPITAVNQGTPSFTIAGDYAALITTAGEVDIVRSTGNNGTFTVASAVFGGVNTVITVVEAIPSATADGSIQYSTQTVYSKTLTATYADVIPAISISVETDCFCGILKSIDKTNYGTGTIVSRTHTVKYPAALSIADIVSSNATITVSPIYTKTWTTIVETTLSIPITGGTITATITGSKETDVECDLTLCDISCCVISLNNRYIDARTTNPVLADKYFADLTRVMQLIEIFQMATSCSQASEASLALTEIKTVANCTDGCQCSDDEPNLVIPLCSSSSGGANINVVAGTGIVVTASLANGNYTYSVALSSSILAILNSVLPQNITVGTGLSVTSSIISGVKTWVLTNTAPFTEENRMEFRSTITTTTIGAPVITVTNSNYLVSGSNMNPTATITNVTVGLANGKNINNLFRVSGFQVSPTNTYKVSINSTIMGLDFNYYGVNSTVTAANMYLGSQVAQVEILNQISGQFDFRFVGVAGRAGSNAALSNDALNAIPNIIVNIKISE